MRAIILGANGFIGSAFFESLKSSRSEVVGLVRHPHGPRDTLCVDYHPSSLKDVFESLRPDRVILAAGSASVSASVQNPQADYEGSVLLVEKVLTGLSMAKLSPEIFFTSTASVYGNPCNLPVSEEANTGPISPYGAHRMQCEKLILVYGAQNGVKAICGRAFSLFGPKQRKLVLWEIAQQAITSGSVLLQGSGSETRDYLEVSEFVRRSLLAMDLAPIGSLVLNIASGKTISILQLARKILAVLDMPMSVRTLNQDLSWNPPNWAADISRYQKLTGDLSEPDFERSLRDCLIAWKTALNQETAYRTSPSVET